MSQFAFLQAEFAAVSLAPTLRRGSKSRRSSVAYQEHGLLERPDRIPTLERRNEMTHVARRSGNGWPRVTNKAVLAHRVSDDFDARLTNSARETIG